MKHIDSNASRKNKEEWVAKETSSIFPKDSYFLRNTYFSWNNGTTTEVDEIVISDSGIYVMEVKDYSGWIFGSEKARYWTHTFPKGWHGNSEKFKFYNPIKQNDTHIRCIKEILKKNSVPIHSIILFSNYCTLKKVFFDSTNVKVIYDFELKDTVNEIEKTYKNVLSKEEVERIYNTLLSSSNKEEGVKERHISSINKRKQLETLSKDEGLKCPACGSELVLRVAKKGRYSGLKFYGCSSFPKCKYTRNIPQNKMPNNSEV